MKGSGFKARPPQKKKLLGHLKKKIWFANLKIPQVGGRQSRVKIRLIDKF